jgi:hypothetical protein
MLRSIPDCPGGPGDIGRSGNDGRLTIKRLLAAVVIATGLAVPAAAQPDPGPLAAAKDLYASARYDEALTALNALRADDGVDRKSVEQYRSLCLLALGRTSEAESAIGAVVTADPTYQPGETDASPRVRVLFTEVRRRLLPDLATARYLAAKAAYDRREWSAAEHQFRLVLALIDDPDTGGRLRDLRVLTIGFLELSAKAVEPPPPPPPPAPEPAAPTPGTVPAPSAVVHSTPEPGRIYSLDDTAVSPSTIVKQETRRCPSPCFPSRSPAVSSRS